MIVVTTSWDDGDRCDLRLAEMLSAHGMAGTFYIPIEPFHAGRELSTEQMRDLATGNFEIGGHSVSHRNLTKLPYEEQLRETLDCRRILEDRLGLPIKSFCYPNGKVNQSVVRCVENAGYQGARTTRMLCSSLQFRRFEMPTTLQAFPLGPGHYLRNLARGANMAGLADYVVRLRRADSWVDLGKTLFDRVLEKGGCWHLYGHSWELEDLNLWKQLDDLLSYVGQRPGVHYVTNAGVYRILGMETAVPRINDL
jgi:peptidoglycan/xylan/chitin deacetylase (PgdA/CDA1 family)